MPETHEHDSRVSNLKLEDELIREAVKTAMKRNHGNLKEGLREFRAMLAHDPDLALAVLIRQPEASRAEFYRVVAEYEPSPQPQRGGQGFRATQLATASSAARTTAVADAVRKSKLIAFRIMTQSGEKPIGDCTAGEAGDWVCPRERDNRFVRLLITGLAPNQVIKEVHTDKEADRLWRMAERG
jgi:hypothetical protein